MTAEVSMLGREHSLAQSWAGPGFERTCAMKPREAVSKETIWGLTSGGCQQEGREGWEQEEGAGETLGIPRGCEGVESSELPREKS